MTLKELLTITDEAVHIFNWYDAGSFPTNKHIITIYNSLLVTDGLLSEDLLNREISRIYSSAEYDGLCVEMILRKED